MAYFFFSYTCILKPGEALPHTWESNGPYIVQHALTKTLLTHWKCEIVLLNRHFYLFFHVHSVPDSINGILLIRSHETPFDTRLNASSNLYESCIVLQLDMM